MEVGGPETDKLDTNSVGPATKALLGLGEQGLMSRKACAKRRGTILNDFEHYQYSIRVPPRELIVWIGV